MGGSQVEEDPKFFWSRPKVLHFPPSLFFSCPSLSRSSDNLQDQASHREATPTSPSYLECTLFALILAVLPYPPRLSRPLHLPQIIHYFHPRCLTYSSGPFEAPSLFYTNLLSLEPSLDSTRTLLRARSLPYPPRTQIAHTTARQPEEYDPQRMERPEFALIQWESLVDDGARFLTASPQWTMPIPLNY